MEDERGIRCTVEEHFKSVLSFNGHNDWVSLLDCVKPIIMAKIKYNLSKPIEEEIKNVVFQMGGMKAPRPDGIQGFSSNPSGRLFSRKIGVLQLGLFMVKLAQMSLI